MNYTRIFILFQLSSILLKADVYEGYAIFTPGRGVPGGGGGDIITYLMDHNNNEVHTWSHNQNCASIPYLFPRRKRRNARRGGGDLDKTNIMEQARQFGDGQRGGRHLLRRIRYHPRLND